MIAKAGEEDIQGLANSKKVWLPYMSNLALVQAVIATTTGAPSDLTGIEPLKKETKNQQHNAKLTTLRLVVDLKLIEDKKMRAHYQSHPHTSLHHALGECKCKEIKTHGWSIGEDLMTGYCSVSEEVALEVLSTSGIAGVFSTRLRQDVLEPPPVTWIRKAADENDLQYHSRALAQAKLHKTTLTRRQGGGAYIGVLMEDTEERNRAWMISGIPHTWGPCSVKTWLALRSTTFESWINPCGELLENSVLKSPFANSSMQMLPFLRQIRLLAQRNEALRREGAEVKPCGLDNFVLKHLERLGWSLDGGLYRHP